MNIFVKNIFDYFLSFLLLVFLSPILVLLIVFSSFSTRKFGIFSQERIGKNGKVFRIYKIRSMYVQSGDVITASNDPRITKFGHFVRMTKLDELPQLINILMGDMSFVGPRPDVKGYADKLEGKDKIILSVKPGITGPATLYYRNEEELLAKQENKDKYNDEVIWPNKVKINREYLENWSSSKDFDILLKTLFGK
jgi:lipopolysaccharide/colanic/teichoic acid biosynthesis glycosyltransferase